MDWCWFSMWLLDVYLFVLVGLCGVCVCWFGGIGVLCLWMLCWLIVVFWVVLCIWWWLWVLVVWFIWCCLGCFCCWLLWIVIIFRWWLIVVVVCFWWLGWWIVILVDMGVLLVVGVYICICCCWCFVWICRWYCCDWIGYVWNFCLLMGVFNWVVWWICGVDSVWDLLWVCVVIVFFCEWRFVWMFLDLCFCMCVL